MILVIAIAVLAGLSSGYSPAFAQTYPDKPIRFLLPYSPGGSYDAIARMFGQALSERWGQQIVIDNRPGAAGRIGTEAVAKSAPDGYTISMFGNNQTIVPSVYKQVPYDLERDFAPIGMVATLNNVLVVHPSVPVRNAGELLGLARAKPGQILFASGGTGGITHLAGELFKLMGRVNVVHVPYKGSASAMLDVVGGQVHMMLLNMLNATPHMKSGRLRGLAVTSAKRSRFLPELPTLDEAGMKGYELTEWYGIVAPARTPAAVLDRWQQALPQIVGSEAMRDALAKQAAEPVPMTAQEFGAFLKADLAKYAHIVRDAGIKPE